MTELLGVQDAFIDELVLDPFQKSRPPRCTSYEDDYASNGEPGLANFATALFSPLEAQGRGFSHGHTKVMGVPHTAEAKLRHMFEQEDETLREILQRAREELLRCAATIMYDSAALPGEQLGEEVLPEPFSKQQRVQKPPQWWGGDWRPLANAAGGHAIGAAGPCGAGANTGGGGAESLPELLQRSAAHWVPAVGVAYVPVAAGIRPH